MNTVLTVNPAPTGVRANLVLCAAGFWGLMLFFPVGMNYLALFLLLLATLVDGQWRTRMARVRQHVLWWPFVAFVIVTLIAFALQDRIYKETPANAWHGFRIVLTLALALSLSEREARCAVIGFGCAFAMVLLILAGFHIGVLPTNEWINHLTHPSTNKSIAASILFSLLAAAAWTGVWNFKGKWRWVALAWVALALLVILVALEKRTAVLGFLLGVLLVMVHQWRAKHLYLLASVLAILVATLGAYQAMPGLQERMSKGVTEAQAALDGKVEVASWNIRIQMIRHTSNMVVEKPLTGWGVGAWNTQWHARAPDIMKNYNMPHNDLLWMGSQAGVPGALAWLALLLAAAWAGWRIQTWQGRIAFAIALIALFSSMVNSGTRDAEIGLPMLWMLGVALVLARESAKTQGLEKAS
jgi:O-antigen ligase